MKSRVVLLCTSLGLVAAAVLVLSQGANADDRRGRPKTEMKSTKVTRLGETRLLDTGAQQVTASTLGAPALSCTGVSSATSLDLQVCAGTGGAPAGYTVQWMTCDAYDNYSGPLDSNQWPADKLDASGNENYCAASLSGVPACSKHNLPNAGDCDVITIGGLNDDECGVGTDGCAANELEACTCYVFRGFAHNVPGPGGSNRSPFTGPPHTRCDTTGCRPQGGACDYSYGYWKQHDGSGPQADAWPNLTCSCGSGYMCIGGACYNRPALSTNLGANAGGNGVKILSHQLIGALLNIGAGLGSDCYSQAVGDAIAHANALLTGHDINTYSVTGGGALKTDMVNTAAILEVFNATSLEAGGCECP